MRTTGRMLAVLLLCWAIGDVSLAQEGEKLETFLADGSPALLFQIDGLTLQSWYGGIGMMFSASERVHWRVAFSPRFSESVSKSSDTAMSSQPYENTKTTSGVSVFFGPMWVLYRKGEFCFTAGPEFIYEYQMQKYQWTSSSESYENHTFGLNGSFGAGYALTDGLLMHAEYVLKIGYDSGTTKESRRSDETESDSWYLASSARLGLLVRL
jgi:hypothetical protein